VRYAYKKERAGWTVCLFVLRGSHGGPCDFSVYHRWNYALSGLNPWSYHAVNVILHAAVSALFAWLCRNCLGLSKLSSLLTASLFAIHPIHTEAVTSLNIHIRNCRSPSIPDLELLLYSPLYTSRADIYFVVCLTARGIWYKTQINLLNLVNKITLIDELMNN